MRPGLRAKLLADETGLGWLFLLVCTQPAVAADSACIAGGLRIDALVDVVAHMRSAKVGLVTRTAAAALRTVPAGRDRCTFLCVQW